MKNEKLQKKLLKDKNNNLIDYKSDIDEFLGNSMDIINRFSDEKINDLKEIFDISMKNSYQILDFNAFRIPTKSDRKRPINMALFEALSYLMSFDKIVNKDINMTKNKITKLLDNERFINIITYKLDSSINVKERFEKMKEILEELKI